MIGLWPGGSSAHQRQYRQPKSSLGEEDLRPVWLGKEYYLPELFYKTLLFLWYIIKLFDIYFDGPVANGLDDYYESI